MGTYNKGILGAFSGKVGPVVGANWRGKDVMRSLPKKSKRNPTENQLLQRMRFTAVATFLKPLRGLTSLYFGYATGDKSKVNMATSYHMKEAVEFDGTDFVVLYNKVQISKGVLLGLQTPTVTPGAGGVLQFSWTDNSGQGTAKGTDTLLVVIYGPLNDQTAIFLEAGMRAELSATVTLPEAYVATEVHCWIAFISDTGKLYSTSNYMGTIAVV